MDRVTKEQRSINMAAVKSKGNKTTEEVFRKLLKENGMTGWRRHYRRLEGTPDFVFIKQKIAIFLDGCFWHGCPKCYKAPKSNKKFWKQKIERNRMRDRKVDKILKFKGWQVIHIWEHQLKNKKYITNKLKKYIGANSLKDA